jgi:hypothetical protein
MDAVKKELPLRPIERLPKKEIAALDERIWQNLLKQDHSDR